MSGRVCGKLFGRVSHEGTLVGGRLVFTGGGGVLGTFGGTLGSGGVIHEACGSAVGTLGSWGVIGFWIIFLFCGGGCGWRLFCDSTVFCVGDLGSVAGESLSEKMERSCLSYCVLSCPVGCSGVFSLLSSLARSALVRSFAAATINPSRFAVGMRNLWGNHWRVSAMLVRPVALV